MKVSARDWRFLVVVLVLFAASRIFLLWWTQEPDHFFGGDATGDLTLYERYGDEIVNQGISPYVEDSPTVQRGIEYPPGSLPFIIAPTVVGGLSYSTLFTLGMAVVDALGLLALYVMARRGASAWGMLVWVLVVPLAGPTLYSRLDLVPAVALVWALERAQAESWYGAGGLLGFGTVVKLVPGFMLPPLFAWSPKRWRVVASFAMVGVLMLMPFIAAPRGLYDSVLGYHSKRGIEIGSLWGGLLMVGEKLGGEISLRIEFGAYEVHGGPADAFVTLSTLLAVVALAGGTWLAWRLRDRPLADLSLVLLGTMALLVGLGKVYSAQYVVWLVALGAVAAALAGSRARAAVLVLATLPVLTYWYFPVRYIELVELHDSTSIAVLMARNLLTLAVAGLALWAGTRALRGGSIDAVSSADGVGRSDDDVTALQEEVGPDALVDGEHADVVPTR
jgi:hypothetical protein